MHVRKKGSTNSVKKTSPKFCSKFVDNIQGMHTSNVRLHVQKQLIGKYDRTNAMPETATALG